MSALTRALSLVGIRVETVLLPKAVNELAYEDLRVLLLEVVMETEVRPDLIIESESLRQMRERGGKWAVYQNVALDSANAGHLQFLQYGEGRAHKNPPKRMPDTAFGFGWKYMPVGFVDLKEGKVVEAEPKE